MRDTFINQRIALASAVPELGKTLIADSSDDESIRIYGASGWVRGDGCVVESVRDHLERRGDWDPRAEVIVVDADSIRETAADLGYGYEEALLAVVCHEAAHILPKRPTPPQDRELVSVDDPDFVMMKSTCYDQAREFQPWGSHGPKWHRLVIHLCSRVRAAGYACADEYAFGGLHYGLPPAWQLVEALADEPQRMKEWSFADVEAADPPGEFVDIFYASADFHRTYLRSL